MLGGGLAQGRVDGGWGLGLGSGLLRGRISVAQGKQGEHCEVEAALRRRAVELWGEERAAEIEGTIEDAARSIWLVESNPPPSDEEPAQYLTSGG